MFINDDKCQEKGADSGNIVEGNIGALFLSLLTSFDQKVTWL